MNDTPLQDTKPKTSQDGESAGVGTCGLARDQNVCTTLRAQKLATGVQLGGGWSARHNRGRGPPSFAEVLKTEAQRVSPVMMQATATTSATGQEAPVAMDSEEQQEATRQTLTELGKISPTSRMLETLRWQIWWRPGRRIRRRCGTPSRRHNGSSWHRMHGRRLRASVARLGKRRWRREALRLLLEAKNQACWWPWRSKRPAGGGRVGDTTSAGAGAGQRSHDAGGACWHAAALGGGVCRGVAAGGRQAISVSPDAMRHHILENWRGHRRRSGSRPGHPRDIGAPSFRAATGKASRDPYQPPQLRVGGPRED